MTRWLLTAVCIAGLLPAAEAAPAEVGKTAPDFTLTSTEGKKVNLEAYRGKTVVLEWTNYDCPFVKKHYDTGNMQELQRTYTGKGVVWLAVSSSAKGKQGNYTAARWNELIAARKSAATAVLLDPTGEVGRRYGARTTPHMFVIDAKGTVVYAGAIDDKPSFKHDDVKGAKNYVEAALEATLSGRAVDTVSTRPYGCSVKY